MCHVNVFDWKAAASVMVVHFSLLLRFVDDTFDPEIAATIGLLQLAVSFTLSLASVVCNPPASLSFSGVDFRVTSMVVDGNRVKLAIWVSFSFKCSVLCPLCFYKF